MRTPLPVHRPPAAALAVLDDGGIDAVTVRAVAARLDVRAPALCLVGGPSFGLGREVRGLLRDERR
nr:hypothetical protein GCM10020063_035220 [Dactylosporangium thailandense]